MNKCLFINPDSSVYNLAEFFLDKGIECHALIDLKNLHQRHDQNTIQNQTLDFPYHFFKQYYFSIERFEKTIKFKNLQYDAIIPSGDKSVKIAEEFSLKFNCKGNLPTTSHLRINKFSMYKALEKKGILQIPFSYITCLEDYFNRVRQNLQEKEYILKPTDGSGNDGVVYCKNLFELDSNVKKIQWKRESAFASNTSFIIQEFIDGVLFSIDLLIHEEKYVITSCCYTINDYQMTNNKDLYASLDQKYSIPIDTSHLYVKKIEPLAFKVSKILGINYGPAHLEFLVRGEQIFFIDVGARLHGGYMPILFQYCYENDLISSYYNLLFGEGWNLKPGKLKFKSVWSSIFYEKAKYKYFHDFKENEKQQLSQLQTMKKMILFIKKGQKYKKTNRLCYGLFMNNNLEFLLDDISIYEKIMAKAFDTKNYDINQLKLILKKIFNAN